MNFRIFSIIMCFVIIFTIIVILYISEKTKYENLRSEFDADLITMSQNFNKVKFIVNSLHDLSYEVDPNLSEIKRVECYGILKDSYDIEEISITDYTSTKLEILYSDYSDVYLVLFGFLNTENV